MPSFVCDLELVLPFWQGGFDPRLIVGADAMAARIPERAPRRRVPPLEANAPTEDGVARLGAVREFLTSVRGILDREQPERLLTIGGDCTIEVASVGHLLDKHPGLRVLWIDAHGDLNSPASSHSGAAHGMPLRALLGDGHPVMVPRGRTLSPDSVLLVGVRDLDPAERDFIDRFDLATLSPENLKAGPSSAAAAWLRRPGPLYVHLDLDVLDPEAWPAVELPTVGGLGIEALAAFLRSAVARNDVVGVAITEHVPARGWDLATLDPVLDALGVRDGTDPLKRSR